MLRRPGPAWRTACKWQQLTPCSSRLAQLGPRGSAGRRWVRVGAQADGAAAFVLAQPQGWREAFGACSRALEASDCISLAEPSHVLQRRQEEGECLPPPPPWAASPPPLLGTEWWAGRRKQCRDRGECSEHGCSPPACSLRGVSDWCVSGEQSVPVI